MANTRSQPRATTPLTPDTIRSRAKTPDALRPHRPPSAEIPAMPHKEQTISSVPASSALKTPKVFCETDFKKFLSRQDLHKTLQAKHHRIPNGLTAGLRPTPLCPILSGNGYMIHGSVYIEADFRNKKQQGMLDMHRFPRGERIMMGRDLSL